MAWDTTGCDVVTSKDSASYVLFSKSGETTIRQCETVLVTETRGLTENAAKEKVTPPTHTNFVETNYFRVIGNVTYKIVVRTGKETRHAARRADESNRWIYTKTETTFAPNVTVTDYGWSSTDDGHALTNAGVEVPVSSDKTSSYQYSYSGSNIYATVTTNVTEYRNVTEAGKNAYLAQASSGAQMKSHNYVKNRPSDPNYTGLYGTVAYSVFMDGTDVTVSARKVSDEEGWTVTKTTKVYGWSATTVHSTLVNGWELGNAV